MIGPDGHEYQYDFSDDEAWPEPVTERSEL